MMASLTSYFTTNPLIWILSTLVVYHVALSIYHHAGANPLLHPVAVSTATLVTGLRVTHIDYLTYFEGNQFIHLLLGPATVALAVPLYRQIKSVKRNWFALMCGALLGSTSAVVTAMALASLLGASHATILSMAAKSVTMPIAISLTEKIGGTASLTSALVMLTGIMGAASTQIILKRVRITDPDICGFTLGVVGHGIGTSRALQISQDMGAFAGLAMSLAGVLTAVLVPGCLQIIGLL